MAEEKTEAPKPAPTPPPPPKPQVSVAEQARADIAAARTGFRPDRPLHYAAAFVRGTASDFFGKTSKWGRFGFKWGAISGVALAYGFPALQVIASGPLIASATTALAPLMMLGPVGIIAMCVVGSVMAGAALGGAHGLLTGGKREMGREMRRDKYAEDLAQRSAVRGKVQANTGPGRNEQRRKQSIRDAFSATYALERDAEEQRDFSTYWQDREAGRGAGGSRYR